MWVYYFCYTLFYLHKYIYDKQKSEGQVECMALSGQILFIGLNQNIVLKQIN